MPHVAQRFRSGNTDYVILRRGERPLIVEETRMEEALLLGAQSYPVVCNSDFECWLDIPEDHLLMLQQEMDWKLR